MRNIFLLCLLATAPFFADAQNTWKVWVGGSPSPYYAPSDLVIEVGDVVEWENIQGTHNVSMTSGPEDFSNGSPAAAPWTHSFTFNTAGSYAYECTVPGHAATQNGTITVIDNQTYYEVTAGGTPGGLPEPYFNVNVLTIQQGDTVFWNNIEGFHDITTTTGPEDFSFAPAGTGWTHEWVFNIAGTYEYECGVGSHALTQFGSVVVEDSTQTSSGIFSPISTQSTVTVGPNPFSETLTVDISEWAADNSNWTMEIYTLDGKRVYSTEGYGKRAIFYGLELEPNNYLLRLTDGTNNASTIISRQ